MTEMTPTPDENNYLQYLYDIATENPFRPSPSQAPRRPAIDAPATFLIDFLTHIRDATPPLPITRHGMDAALDIVFSHPSLRQLLLDDHSTAALQEHYATTYVAATATSDLFRAHWTHIILPAWNQHRDIQRALAATAMAALMATEQS